MSATHEYVMIDNTNLDYLDRIHVLRNAALVHR